MNNCKQMTSCDRKKQFEFEYTLCINRWTYKMIPLCNFQNNKCRAKGRKCKKKYIFMPSGHGIEQTSECHKTKYRIK